MANDDMPVQEEQFESIPWSHLVEQPGRKPWLVYVVAAAVLALVVGVTMARTAPPRTPDQPVPGPVSTTVPPRQPALLTEADLIAPARADRAALAAAMRAEWFVTESGI